MVIDLKRKKLQVILLPELVPSASYCLGNILRFLGHGSKVLSRYPHKFGFVADEYVTEKNRSRLRQFIDHLLAAKYIFESWDVVHFNYGSTLLDPKLSPDGKEKNLLWFVRKKTLALLQKIEIKILVNRGIPIFVHFQGDDAVQGDISLQIFQESIAQHVESGYYSQASDIEKRERIRWFDSFASGIFAVSPDMMWFLPPRAKFIPYACIKLLELPPNYPTKYSKKIRISHAPSHRGAKGTFFIEEAIKVLIAEKLDFEYVTLENLNHSQLLKEINNCDLFIDQLHHGWYGGVAVEAMALGKPVMAYIRETDLIHVPKNMVRDIPIINVTADSITQALREYILSADESLHEIGIKSRKYVETWHNPKTVGSIMLSEYEKACYPD